MQVYVGLASFCFRIRNYIEFSLHRFIQEVILLWFAVSCWSREWSNPELAGSYIPTSQPTSLLAARRHARQIRQNPQNLPTPFLPIWNKQVSPSYSGRNCIFKYGERIFGEYWQGLLSPSPLKSSFLGGRWSNKTRKSQEHVSEGWRISIGDQHSILIQVKCSLFPSRFQFFMLKQALLLGWLWSQLWSAAWFPYMCFLLDVSVSIWRKAKTGFPKNAF